MFMEKTNRENEKEEVICC